MGKTNGIRYVVKAQNYALMGLYMPRATAHIAVIMNPAHANFPNPQLWEAQGIILLDDDGLKCGVKTLTTIKQIPLPQITTEQRIHFAILCALEVYDTVAIYTVGAAVDIWTR